MAASLVVAGFFLIPILQALLPGLLGAIVGNGVLGGGWAWLAFELRQSTVIDQCDVMTARGHSPTASASSLPFMKTEMRTTLSFLS